MSQKYKDDLERGLALSRSALAMTEGSPADWISSLVFALGLSIAASCEQWGVDKEEAFDRATALLRTTVMRDGNKNNEGVTEH